MKENWIIFLETVVVCVEIGNPPSQYSIQDLVLILSAACVEELSHRLVSVEFMLLSNSSKRFCHQEGDLERLGKNRQVYEFHYKGTLCIL